MKRNLKRPFLIGIYALALLGGASGCNVFFEDKSPYCENDDQQSRVFCTMSKPLPYHLGSDDVQYFDVCADDSASVGMHMRMFLESSSETGRVSVVGGLCDVESALDEATVQWGSSSVDFDGVKVIVVLPSDQDASVFEAELQRLGSTVQTYSIEEGDSFQRD